MKKNFLLLVFFIVSLNALAYTRAENIKNKLSKIGVNKTIIDKTIELDYEIKDDFSEDFDDKMEKLQNLYAQDNKNFYVSDLIANGYIFSDEKDFNKAKEYLEKGEKYNEKFDNLLNKVNLYTVFNKEKDEKRYKNELKKIYNGTPVMDLLDFIYSGIENYRDEKLSNSSDDLPFGSFYDENTGEIINGIADDDDGNDNKNMNFEESLDEINKTIRNSSKETDKNVEKFRRILKYFSDEKNKQKFSLTDDIYRNLELIMETNNIEKISANDGILKALDYYINNVSNKAQDKEFEFTKDREMTLYALLYLASATIKDEKVYETYRQKLKDTKVAKLLRDSETKTNK
jgi:hypothetical protein cdivTM_04875